MFKNKSSKKRPEISGPLSFEHRVHTGYDTVRGQFVGLPKQWAGVVEPTSTNRPKPIVDPSFITHTIEDKQKAVVRGHSNSHLNGDVHGISVARSNSLRQYSPGQYRKNNYQPTEPSLPEYDRGPPGRPPSGYGGPPPGYSSHGDTLQHPPPYHDYNSLPRSNSRRDDMYDPREQWNNQRNIQDDPRFGNGPRDQSDMGDPRDMNRHSQGYPDHRDPRDINGPQHDPRNMNSLPRHMNGPYDPRDVNGPPRDPRDMYGPLGRDMPDSRMQDPHYISGPGGPGGDMRDPRDPNGVPPLVRDPRDPNGVPPHMRDPRDPDGVPPLVRDPRDPNGVPPHMRDPNGVPPHMRDPRDPNGVPPQIRDPRDSRNMGPNGQGYNGAPSDYRDYRDDREYGRHHSMHEDMLQRQSGTLPRDNGTLPRESSTLPRGSTLQRDNSTLSRDVDPHNNNIPQYSKSGTLPPRSPTGGHYAPYQQQPPPPNNGQPNSYSSLPRNRESDRTRSRPDLAPKPQPPPQQQQHMQQHAQQYDRGMEHSPQISTTPSSPNHHPPSPRSPKPAETPSSIGPYPSSPGTKSPYPEQQRLSHEQVTGKRMLIDSFECTQASKRLKSDSSAAEELFGHIYEEIPCDYQCEDQSNLFYGDFSMDTSQDNFSPQPGIFINKTGSMRPDLCCICNQYVRCLRRHANARHLPWFVDVVSACALCSKQVNHSTYMKHHTKAHPGRQIVMQPSVWINRMREIFEKICRLLHIDSLHDIPLYARTHGFHLRKPVQLNFREQPYFAAYNISEKFDACSPQNLRDCSHWRIMLKFIGAAGFENFSDLVSSIKPDEGKVFIRRTPIARPKEPDHKAPSFLTSHAYSRTNSTLFTTLPSGDSPQITAPTWKPDLPKRPSFGLTPNKILPALKSCIICGISVQNLREHANTCHLPWFVDAPHACVLCCRVAANKAKLLEHASEHKSQHLLLEQNHWFMLMVDLFDQIKDGLGVSNIYEIPKFVNDKYLGLETVEIDDDYAAFLGEDFNGKAPKNLLDCCHWMTVMKLIQIAGSKTVFHLIKPMYSPPTASESFTPNRGDQNSKHYSPGNDSEEVEDSFYSSSSFEDFASEDCSAMGVTICMVYPSDLDEDALDKRPGQRHFDMSEPNLNNKPILSILRKNSFQATNIDCDPKSQLSTDSGKLRCQSFRAAVEYEEKTDLNNNICIGYPSKTLNHTWSHSDSSAVDYAYDNHDVIHLSHTFENLVHPKIPQKIAPMQNHNAPVLEYSPEKNIGFTSKRANCQILRSHSTRCSIQNRRSKLMNIRRYSDHLPNHDLEYEQVTERCISLEEISESCEQSASVSTRYDLPLRRNVRFSDNLLSKSTGSKDCNKKRSETGPMSPYIANDLQKQVQQLNRGVHSISAFLRILTCKNK